MGGTDKGKTRWTDTLKMMHFRCIYVCINKIISIRLGSFFFFKNGETRCGYDNSSAFPIADVAERRAAAIHAHTN